MVRANEILDLFKSCLSLNADIILFKSEGEEVHLYRTDSRENKPQKINNDLKLRGIDLTDIRDYLKVFSFKDTDLESRGTSSIFGPINIIFKNENCFFVGKVAREDQLNKDESSLQIEFRELSVEVFNQYFRFSHSLARCLEELRLKDSFSLLVSENNRVGLCLLNLILEYPRQVNLEDLRRGSDIISPENSQRLIITHTSQDPVEGMMAYLELAKSKNFLETAIDSLALSCAFLSVKGQCQLCSKPTSITKTSISAFPLAYQEKIPDSYQFSRGCQACGYSSYRGMAFLESFFLLTVQSKSALKLSLDPKPLYKAMTENLGSTFYESAICKIKSGEISIGEAARVLPPIPTALEAFLSNKSDSNGQGISPQRPRILIIEDDESQQNVLKIVFQREGYEVYTADNGKIALDFIRNTKVEIILSDLMMPQVNGLEFLKACKKDPNLSKIPVIMLTASGDPNHELTLLEQGADDYCPKNVKKKVLLKRVEKLLKNGSQSENPLNHMLTD